MGFFDFVGDVVGGAVDIAGNVVGGAVDIAGSVVGGAIDVNAGDVVDVVVENPGKSILVAVEHRCHWWCRISCGPALTATVGRVYLVPLVPALRSVLFLALLLPTHLWQPLVVAH